MTTSRRLPHTPSSHIRNALRSLTMRCRERQAARKASGYRCSECGAKHSRAAGRPVTVEAHHTRPPNWERVIRVIREELLQTADAWQPLCSTCHDRKHWKETP